jgi:hypothetical protein
MSEDLRTKEYRIYKPTKSGEGAATKINIVLKTPKRPDGTDGFPKLMMFLVSAPQVPSTDPENAAFGWEDQNITAQLGDVDISAIIAVLDGRKEALGRNKDGQWSGLYHENAKGNTVIKLAWNDQNRLYYELRRKRDGQLSNVKHVIEVEEAIILKSICESYFKIKYGMLS